MTVEPVGITEPAHGWEGLCANLEWLDGLLDRALKAAQQAYGAPPGADLYRGLYISSDEVERLMQRRPGAPAFSLESEESPSLEDGSRLTRLADEFDLTPFDAAVVLVALAPELDLRYERLYAYLQDDVTRRRPSVDLCLNLLCASAEEKLMRRGHFGPTSPLLRQRILELVPDSSQIQPPLLAHYCKLDPQIVNVLLGEEDLDARLASCCELTGASAEEQSSRSQPQLALYFTGPETREKRRAAHALARERGETLLTVDVARVCGRSEGVEQFLRLVFREASFRRSVLYLDGVDLLHAPEHQLASQALPELVASQPGVTILAGTRERSPVENIWAAACVQFGPPDSDQRRRYWREGLERTGVELPADLPNLLADRFRLNSSQIGGAIATAASQARWRGAIGGNGTLTGDDLLVSARSQFGADLAALARKVEPVYRWCDIVLPEDSLQQLREICQRVALRRRVFSEWGFDRKLSLGKGVNALFAGPSGTGKTMAAEVLANELALDLYKIDLAGVVSKYIGETEKNLDRIFTAAEDANAILFFDEADALFGKRSEVRDSHDRYANIEVSYLLQKMEQYEGVAILATNLRGNLDEAFLRRLTFTVHFPSPDEASRRQIWSGIWPAQIPLAEDVDLDYLARGFKMAGGNIKNIALASAFLAAETGAVGMEHLMQATRREYQKLGKSVTETELKGWEKTAVAGSGQ